MKKVGVLALQGGFLEHIAALHRLGAGAFPVRLPKELKGIDGLVIPGGESTAIGKLMREYHLEDELNKLIAEGVPVFGTCAGMVLLARKVSGMDLQPLGAMDIEVRRNAFGRQVDSFEADLEVPVLGQHPFHAVFIRAPLIERVGGSVEILASLPDGTPVAARENNLVATAFHPELTTDLRFHEYFLTIVDDKLKAKAA
ncbi:MAG: pyridoxal 5'-phosphate synthase glutaminase subunit PdxT [Dehalococcoidia bacterium]|nr:pyridoxal 5'-phosphate synthase glutaminase subunit PdxT [Dehalococcoidia bacterium]